MDEKKLKQLLRSITEHANEIREAQEILEDEFGITSCWGVSAAFADANNKASIQIINGINDIIEALKITEHENRGDIRIATFDGLKIVQVANKETGEFD